MRGTKVQIPSQNTTGSRTIQFHNIHTSALKHRHVRTISRLSADGVIEEEYRHELLRAMLAKASLPKRTSGGGSTHRGKSASPVRLLSQFSATALEVYWQAH